MSKQDNPGQKPENAQRGQNPENTEGSHKHENAPGSHKPNKGNEHVRQPDEETLGTTDPQEHMHGPVSSFMKKVQGVVDKNDEDDREEVRKEDREDKDPSSKK